jgi:hypothetical protein
VAGRGTLLALCYWSFTRKSFVCVSHEANMSPFLLMFHCILLYSRSMEAVLWSSPPPPGDMNLFHPEEMKRYESSPVQISRFPRQTISSQRPQMPLQNQSILHRRSIYVLYVHVFVLTSFRNGHWRHFYGRMGCTRQFRIYRIPPEFFLLFSVLPNFCRNWQ